jgi:hypothetical protein
MTCLAIKDAVNYTPAEDFSPRHRSMAFDLRVKIKG